MERDRERQKEREKDRQRDRERKRERGKERERESCSIAYLWKLSSVDLVAQVYWKASLALPF